MRVVKVIQPHEFGDNFILEDGKWKVKFPPIATSGVEVSKDANNLITLGGDGGMFADATRLHAYALVQDNENMKIHLYRHQADLEFDVANATLINSIDMLELNGQFDDITITDAVVTFKDVQTETELEFDTNQFQNVEELYFDWPLSTEKDDKLKVGATDRIELKLRSDPNDQNDEYWTSISAYSFLDHTHYIFLDWTHSNIAVADALKDNIVNVDFGNSVKVEKLSETLVDGILETVVGFTNLSSELFGIEVDIGAQRAEGFSVLQSIEGNPAVNWSYQSTISNTFRFYLAPAGTVVEDNGISPTASVIDLYIPKYINENFLENALVKTPEGLLVLSPGMEIEHTLEARSYQVDVPNDEIEIEEFVRTINGNEIRMPAVTLKNLRGKTLGAIVAKIPDKLHTYEPR